MGDILAFGVATCMAVTLIAARWTGKNIVTSLAVGSLGIGMHRGLLGPANRPPHRELGLARNQRPARHPDRHGALVIGPRYLPASEVAMFFLLELILTPCGYG